MNDIKMRKEQAVSPVIGIMMMLVVTIVIAAVVAGFAGAITSTEQAAPTTTFDVSYKASISDTDKTNHVPDYPATNPPKNNGITFKVLNGDSMKLENIKVILSSEGESITLASDSKRANSTVINTDVIEMMGDSFFAVPKGMDTTISAGKSFTIMSTGYFDNSNEAAAKVKGKFLVWETDNGGKFTLKDFVPVKYTIFDTISGKQIQTGSFIIK